MILKLSTRNRRRLLCIYVCKAWSHNIFQFFVALLKNFPTSLNSLKNAMPLALSGAAHCLANALMHFLRFISWDFN